MFYDPAVPYLPGEPPDALDPYFYIKCGLTGGGYFLLASPDGTDGAFKSTTFFLNEARKTNALPASRRPNVEYAIGKDSAGRR